MKHSVRWLAALLTLFLAQVTAQESPSGSAAVSGHVVDAHSGKPIAGARVYVSREPYVSGLSTPVTDAAGAFSLNQLPSGSYRFSASRGGYLGGGYGQLRPNGESERVTLNDGSRQTDILIRMWPDASIAGRVLDDRGDPMAGIYVYALQRVGEGTPYATAGSSSTTNDLGEYRIIGLPPGEYVVAASCRVHSRVLAGSLVPSTPTAGRGVYRPDFDWTSNFLIEATGGTVAVPQCPLLPGTSQSGIQAFVASAAGAPQLRDAMVLQLEMGESRTHFDVQLSARSAARVAGVVTNPHGPIEGAMVRLVRDDWDGPEYFSEVSTNVARDGTFSMPIVPAGRYTLHAWRHLPPLSDVRITIAGSLTMGMDDVVYRDESAVWARMPLVVGNEPVTDLAVTLRPGTQVNGRIELDAANQPAKTVAPSVNFEPLDGRRSGFGGFWKIVNGRFTVRLAPGRYLLESRPGIPGWLQSGVSVNGRDVGLNPIDIGTEDVDLVVTMTDRIASLGGTVLGEGAVRATVIVFPVQEDAWTAHTPQPMRGPRRLHQERVKAARFNFTTLLPGEYFVAAIDDAHVPAALSRGFLERLSKVASRVQLAAGQPVSIEVRVRTP